MTEQTKTTYGDPITAPFWEAAARRQLLLQRCRGCGAHQFYPRPYCVRCQSEVEWVPVAGTGTVYSMTTVRAQLVPDFPPPYVVVLIELDEGPRLVSGVVGRPVGIGDRVRVQWKERPDGPPLPMFETLEDDAMRRPPSA